MTMFQRRVLVDKIIWTVRQAPEAEMRQQVFRLIEEARLDATREVGFIAGAVVAAAGGRVDLPAELLIALPFDSALQFDHGDDGRMTVRSICLPEDVLLATRAMQQATGGPVDLVVPAVAGASDYPPANHEEADPEARVRICEAVRTLVQRHYIGEFQRRGFDFVLSVFGELLAMALGTKRANQATPPAVAEDLAAVAADVEPRVTHYQQQAEQALRFIGGEPGEPGPGPLTPSRLM